MSFLVITLANLIWILYSMLEGVRDASFIYYKDKNKTRFEIDINYCNLQRLLVLLTTGGIMFWTIGFYFIPFMLAQLFMFKYFYKKTYDKSIDHLQLKKSIKQEEFKKIIDTKKEELILFGISIQAFFYLFFI